MELSECIKTLLKVYSYKEYENLLIKCLTEIFDKEETPLPVFLPKVLDYNSPELYPLFKKYQWDDTMLLFGFWDITNKHLESLVEQVYYNLMNIVLGDNTESTKASIVNASYGILAQYNIDDSAFSKYLTRLSIEPSSILNKANNKIAQDYQQKFFDAIGKLTSRIVNEFGYFINDKVNNHLSKLKSNPEHQEWICNSFWNNEYYILQEKAQPQARIARTNLIWSITEGDLIELVTALYLSGKIKSSSGELTKQQLANFFTDVLGWERIPNQKFSDRDSKNIRRKIDHAKFLKELYNLVAEESEQKTGMKRQRL